VDENYRWVFAGPRLPMAVAANARAGLGFEFARGASREAGKSSPPESGRERLGMRIAQQWMRLERIHSQTFYDR
jgi:hypothetical protein